MRGFFASIAPEKVLPKMCSRFSRCMGLPGACSVRGRGACFYCFGGVAGTAAVAFADDVVGGKVAKEAPRASTNNIMSGW